MGVILRPRNLIIAAVVLFVVGLAYGSIYGGIPYQDPTPEQYASWRFHNRLSFKILNASMLLALAALLLWVWAFVKNATKK